MMTTGNSLQTGQQQLLVVAFTKRCQMVSCVQSIAITTNAYRFQVRGCATTGSSCLLSHVFEPNHHGVASIPDLPLDGLYSIEACFNSCISRRLYFITVTIYKLKVSYTHIKQTDLQLTLFHAIKALVMHRDHQAKACTARLTTRT